MSNRYQRTDPVPEPTSNMENVIISFIALAGLIYLLGAVIWPEKF